MEQGNEGDEIILLALRQIDCETIGDDINSISQLGPESIVEIVARALWLISQGELQFPVKLPKSIAQKHRICTNMATKVKELGFMGDCGYNQLLYPVEAHTRPLLNWLVQKLPRSDDAGAEDVLGGNELIHRRMMDALSSWQRAAWVLPFCSDAAAMKNIYSLKAARVAASRPTLTVGGLENSLPIFRHCNFAESPSSDKSLSTSLFERHALQLQRDVDFAMLLEDGGHQAHVQDFISSASSGKAKKQLLSSAFAGIKKQGQSIGNSVLGTSTVGTGSTFDTLTEQRESELMGKSLADVILDISNDLGGNKSRKDGPVNSNANNAVNDTISSRGTRFTHSTEFAQENASAKGIGSVSATANISTGVGGFTTRSSGGDGGDDKNILSEKSTAGSVAGTNIEGLTAKEKASIAMQAKMEAKKAAAEEEERLLLEELDALREQVRFAENKVEEMERAQENSSSKSRNLDNIVSALQQEGEALEKEIILKRKTLEMLPSASDNIGKLQAICANSAKRLMTLAQEWESHRRPLLEKYRDMKSSKTRRREKCKSMVDDMKRCREEMVAMVQDLRDKQEKSARLVEEVKSLPRNINRTLYTHRIMDIISSIAKQNKDIVKITSDIRDVQKTINQSSNTLQRADAICEDTIYMAANSPNSTQAMINSYRNLVQIRENFDKLIATVNKIGQLDNQTSELETKVDQEMARVSANNFDRILADLAEVQSDNNRLITQLKSLKK